MVQIIWTERARKDLIQISDYISIDSAKYAKNQIDRIIQKVELLLIEPKSGKAVREIGDFTIREVVEGRYRIIYKLNDVDNIYILAIHHGARDLGKREIK